MKTKVLTQSQTCRLFRFLGTILSICLSSSLLARSLEPTSRPIYAMQFLTFSSGQDDVTFLEVFLQVPTDNLQFIKLGNGFSASYELSVILYDLPGNEVMRGGMTDSVKVQTFAETDGPQQPQLVRMTFLVPSGEYKAHFTFTDQETGSAADFVRDISVPDYTEQRLQLSDLQICHSIVPAQHKDALVKNGWKIEPNVVSTFGPENPTLFVYSEVYNLGFSLDRINKGYIATYTIRDKNGSIVKSYGRPHQKQGVKGLLTARLPIDDLDAGEYRLDLTIIDPDLGQRAAKFANFHIIRDKSPVSL